MDLGTEGELEAAAVEPSDTLWMPFRVLAELESDTRDDAANGAASGSAVLRTVSGIGPADAARHWLLDVERLPEVWGDSPSDLELVAELERGIDALRRLDDRVGGGPLRTPAAGMLRVVVGVFKGGVHGRTAEPGLYRVAAELSCFLGWLCFDAADPRGSRRHWLTALQAAQLSGDRALGAHILMYLADLEAAAGDAATALVILDDALAGLPSEGAAIGRASLQARRARAYAVLGRPGPARDAADAALSLPAAAPAPEDPAWSYWCGEADLNHVIGAAYLALGDTMAAMAHLDRAVAGYGIGRPREQTLAMIGLAESYLRADTPEPAIDLARTIAAVGGRFHSAHTSGAVTGFLRRLRSL